MSEAVALPAAILVHPRNLDLHPPSRHPAPLGVKGQHGNLIRRGAGVAIYKMSLARLKEAEGGRYECGVAVDLAPGERASSFDLERFTHANWVLGPVTDAEGGVLVRARHANWREGELPPPLRSAPFDLPKPRADHTLVATWITPAGVVTHVIPAHHPRHVTLIAHRMADGAPEIQAIDVPVAETVGGLVSGEGWRLS